MSTSVWRLIWIYQALWINIIIARDLHESFTERKSLLGANIYLWKTVPFTFFFIVTRVDVLIDISQLILCINSPNRCVITFHQKRQNVKKCLKFLWYPSLLLLKFLFRTLSLSYGSLNLKKHNKTKQKPKKNPKTTKNPHHFQPRNLSSCQG